MTETDIADGPEQGGWANAVHFCGGTPPAVGRVERYRFVCPWCLGWGTWASGESCKMCAGFGLTDDPDPGVDLHTAYPPGTEPPETQPEPIPRPPGVMRQPCVDCAFRPGSPETDYQRLLPGPDDPFFCHHGLIRRGDGYLSGSTVAGRPLGALVCASWWSMHMEGGQAPTGEFRDPGGSDRGSRPVTARCECCDLPVYSCGKTAETQRRQERAALRARLAERGWFPAEWPGVCGRCGDGFPARAMIVRYGLGWRAECCA